MDGTDILNDIKRFGRLSALSEVEPHTVLEYFPRHLKPRRPSLKSQMCQDGTESGNLVDVDWKSLIDRRAWKVAAVLAVPC
jgi:hypothetical protein